jgi:nucleoside-diphosphate-sugar epimerase
MSPTDRDRTFKDRRALVVGGAGFVGATLVRALLARGVGDVIVVDNFLSSEPSAIPDDPRVTLIDRSITDPAALEALPATIDHVWHLATYHGNQSSIADPLADHANNLLPSLVLFDHLARRCEVGAVVYAGAGCAAAAKMVDDAEATREDAPLAREHDSPYSISKIVGELYGAYFHRQAGLPFVTARFQNVYGPGETLGAGRWRGTPHTVWRNVTPTFVFRALHGEALRLEGGGRATRDFIYVEDVAEGLLRCAAFGEPGGVYNIASGVETSIRALADAIVAEAGSTTPHDIVEARDWDRSLARFGDPSKAKAEIGFAASTPLALGLERTVAWTRDNLAMIRACMARHVGSVPEVARYLDEGASR